MGLLFFLFLPLLTLFALSSLGFFGRFRIKLQNFAHHRFAIKHCEMKLAPKLFKSWDVFLFLLFIIFFLCTFSRVLFGKSSQTKRRLRDRFSFPARYLDRKLQLLSLQWIPSFFCHISSPMQILTSRVV
mmetsp:Transcript_9175/g.21698  ORF Transcript_9175/g.21698 Transcript_9175/m.21698 type:complete len:129 (+) Transcript_9175:3337-3723(+)